MFRTIAVFGTFGWHYVTHLKGKKKYSVQGKELDLATKKEHRKEIYRIVQKLTRGLIKAAGTELVVKGEENLPKEGPVVYMASHKGLYDSPIVASIIDDPMLFIGKKETKKMPIISEWFDAMGCIYIDREDMKQSLQAILEGIQELKQGQSIIIFPEGTRSKSREMGTFKAGSFKLATKANVPIIPIAIQDSHKIVEEKGRVQKATVYVNIGEMIDVPALSAEEKKVLPTLVEDKVRELLAEITM